MKERIIAGILIISGLAGLCMSACGSIFAINGVASLSGTGEAAAFAPIFLVSGLLFGLVPGGIVLVAVWWFRSHIRPHMSDRTRPGGEA